MKKALLGFIFLLVSLWGIGQTTINTGSDEIFGD
jgi:hypothetical protein